MTPRAPKGKAETMPGPTTGHTPGPWTVDARGVGIYADGSLVAAAGPGRDNATCYANARLIAAAPELLRAAKLVASFAVSWEPLTPGDIAELTAAIAKAEGR